MQTCQNILAWFTDPFHPVAGVALRMTLNPAFIGKALDGMVCDSVADDRLSMLRHRFFIATHFGVGLLALSVLPIWLVLFGPTSVTEALAFSWFIAPLAIAGFLSRSGRLEIAHIASAAAITVLIVWVAGRTGGVYSLALVWLPLVPFEASLSGSRRVILAVVGIAMLGFLFLPSAAAAGLLSSGPEFAHNAPIGVSLVIGAILYGGSLTMRIEGLARQSARSADLGEERYRLLADHATDMITRHSANGDVEFASPAARSLTGSSVAEVLGDGLFRRVHVADRPAYLEALSRAYTSRGSTSAEFRLLQATPQRNTERPDFVYVEMRCRPAIDHAGAVSAVVAVTRDVAKGREREGKLSEARKSADCANRAKTQFLAHMSHELRTPLNAIIGFSEILDSDNINDTAIDRRREYAKLIHSSGEHLLEVVNGILDMSKIEAGMFNIYPEPMQLAPVITGCCDMVGQQAIDRGISIVRLLPDDLPEIVADLRACRQVLLNLLSNAIKFTERGGTVTVGARVEGKMMAIFVEDTGIGISADDLPRLGTPFVQVDAVCSSHYEGSGLGLSMVKGLANLHGGRMLIESTPGVGTSASVFLPVERAVDRQQANIFGQSDLSEGEEKERKSA